MSLLVFLWWKPYVLLHFSGVAKSNKELCGLFQEEVLIFKVYWSSAYNLTDMNCLFNKTFTSEEENISKIRTLSGISGFWYCLGKSMLISSCHNDLEWTSPYIGTNKHTHTHIFSKVILFVPLLSVNFFFQQIGWFKERTWKANRLDYLVIHAVGGNDFWCYCILTVENFWLSEW